MKFRNFGQASLAILATLAATIGVTACKQNYTVGYMYVTGVKTGTTTGEIGAFKINSTNGALYTIPGQPFSSGGSNPVRIALDQTGRYVFVLNQGVASTDSSGNVSYTGDGIGVYSVGGDGTLSYQQSYASTGTENLRILEYSGQYLYVLNEYAPAVLPGTETIANAAPSPSPAFPCLGSDGLYHPTGSITAFQVNSNSGVLSLVQNAQQNGITYFPVGCFPVDMHIAGNHIFTMDAGSTSNNDVETVYPYAIGTSGQLTTTTNGPQSVPGAVNINTIDGDSAGSFVFLLDGTTNEIYEYTPGSNGALTPVQGSPFANDSTVSGPDALYASTTTAQRFLYVANAQTTGSPTSAPGQIVTFNILSGTNILQESTQDLNGGSTGSGPVTIMIDPTNQYLYTVDHLSGTITGKLFNPQAGNLVPLNVKGSTDYTTVDKPTWGIIDAHTD